MKKKEKIKFIILGITLLIIAGIMCGIVVGLNNDKRQENLQENKELQNNVMFQEDKDIYTRTDNSWEKENVKISVKEDSISKTSAVIVIEDKNENPVSWGVNFAIQKAGDNNIWVDMITKEIITWVEIAMQPNEKGITEMQLDWSKIYGELSSGTYRVVKYNGLSTLYSEPFIIGKNTKQNNNKSDGEQKLDISSYKGVWQYPDSTYPDEELIIKSIEHNKINFDYVIDGITSFDNVTATLNNNTATFDAKNDGDWNIKGTISFKNNTVFFKINESSNENVQEESITFSIKSNKSILQGVEY